MDDTPCLAGTAEFALSVSGRASLSALGFWKGKELAQQKAVNSAPEEVEDLIDELQPGARLLKGQYTITRYLNSGGFGITYLAKDSLDRDVVIKECFPSAFCRRSKTVVAARSRAHTAELRSIVQLFVREARNLSKIVHPNIVAVHQVFEDNGTAYMAIDYIDGLDLQQVIDGEGSPLTPPQIVNITQKLLVAVGFIHDSDMLHRDISPDNVLIDKSGEPILIDFGAARDQASKTTRAMSALRVVKDGYSPQEFYIAGSEQGPWSDLYALAATLYHLISGEAPVNGQARLAALAEERPDPYVPLAGRYAGYPPGFLEAIDQAMNSLPKQRIQTAAEWLAMFDASAPAVPVAAEAATQSDDDVATAVHQLIEESRDAAAASLPVAEAGTPDPAPTAATPAPARAPSQGTAATRKGKSTAKMVAGMGAALVVVTVGYLVLSHESSLPPSSPETVASDDDAAATTAAASAITAGAASVPVIATETAAEPAPEPATETAEAPEVIPPTPAEPVAEAPAVEPATAEPTVEASAEPALATEAEQLAEAAPLTEAAPSTETPAGPLLANQIAFAAWDVVLPFTSDDRLIDGQPVAVITRVPALIDLSISGDWIAPGITIHAVNGTPIQSSGTLTQAIMNAMRVDPDGKARVVVEYSDASRSRQSGLLTVGAVRLVSLANGVSLRSEVADGAWRTLVTGVAVPELTTLQTGDILFRDRTTSLPLDGPDTLEAIMAELVARTQPQTEFSIIRDNRVGEATMRLALDAGP